MATISDHAHTETNISANTSSFTLMGGLYGIEISATWGGGNVVFGRLSLDGSTYVPVSTYTANTYETQYIPAGTYRLTVTTATAIYAEMIAIAALHNGGL